MPLGQIDLPITFGYPSNYRMETLTFEGPSNYRTETLAFEVVGFHGTYHAVLG